MAQWIYKNEKYKSIPVDWYEFNHYGKIYCEKYEHLTQRIYCSNDRFEILVYNKKWDKCFILLQLCNHGIDNGLKAFIEDIYTKKKMLG